MDDDDLMKLFDEARRLRPPPSQRLMDAVQADAARLQPRRSISTPPRPSIWRRMSAAVGGTAVFAGLTSAALLGLAVGYADPTSASYLLEGLGGGLDTVDLFPITDFDAAEG